MAKLNGLFMTETVENRMSWGNTYLYTSSPYKGAPYPPWGSGVLVISLVYDNNCLYKLKQVRFFFVLSSKRERLMYDWPHSRAVLWSNSKNKRAEIVDYKGTDTQQTPIAFVVRTIISLHPLLVASYMKALWHALISSFVVVSFITCSNKIPPTYQAAALSNLSSNTDTEETEWSVRRVHIERGVCIWEVSVLETSLGWHHL